MKQYLAVLMCLSMLSECHAQMVRGPRTNDLCSAVLIDSTASLDERKANFFSSICTESKIHRYFVLPKTNSAFNWALTDSDGKVVARTKRGEDIGSLPPKIVDLRSKSMRNLHQIFIGSEFVGEEDCRDVFGELNIFDFFNITNRGAYRLTYEQRLYRDHYATNSSIGELFVLPRVEVNFVVH